MPSPQSLAAKALFGLARLIVVLCLLLFIPAWSLRYWEGWIFLGVFSAWVLAISLYFLKHDPALVERRRRAGPAAEKETSQKIIQAFAMPLSAAELIVPALDHRFHWSDVPPAFVICGDALVAAGLYLMFLTMKENSFASSTIEISPGQTVVSTGPYRIVRHPMYAGALLLFAFTPIALGSYWGLLCAPPLFLVIALRLLDEERFLVRNLPGYDAYRRRTRYRLISGIW